MAKLSILEVSEICNQLGESHPKNISQIYGGNIHNSFKLEFKNKSIFLKKNIKKEKFLKYENHCLKDLTKYINNKNLKTPEVYAYLNIKNTEILIIEWIEMSNKNQQKLGKGLAEMHLKSNESNPNKFGYEVEGFIGLSKQLSGWEENWTDCFINLRIKPQLIEFQSKNFNSDLFKKLIFKIKTILNFHKPIISLVHGDLWSGNFGINNFNQGVIFDPASWWADCEVDIAMTFLFGGFKKNFYDEYFKVLPKKKGFEQRVIIYNLYHVLNHANMFGGSYINQANQYIEDILNMKIND